MHTLGLEGRTHRRRQLIIECFGMPAAGKSRVARALVTVLRREGLGVDDYALRTSTRARPRRIFTKARLIFGTAPLWLSHFPSMLRRSRQTHWKSFFSTVTALFNWIYVISLLRRRSNKEIPVLDQGIFQALWSVDFRTINPEPEGRCFLQGWLDESFEVLGRPCMILLVVEAQEARIRERLRTRGHGASPLDGGGEETWREARSSTARVLDVIRLTDLASENLQVVVFDNSVEDNLGAMLEARLAERFLPVVTACMRGSRILEMSEG